MKKPIIDTKITMGRIYTENGDKKQIKVEAILQLRNILKKGK